MTWPFLLFLALELAVFGWWTLLTLRVTSRLVGDAAKRAGRLLPGPSSVLSSMSDWVRDPSESAARRALAGSTALMATLFLISNYA